MDKNQLLMKKDLLINYAKNIYSQNGEDGVIEEILNRLSSNNELNKWCVEFGAWDGMYLSNTCNLIKEKGYKAVLIEGNPKKVLDLNRNFPSNDIKKICRFVNFEGSNSLDNILSETEIPIDFDFLSIDVDGVDYFIFESLVKYRPKVISIEFNPTIPNIVNFIQKKDFRIKQGSSAKALNELGKKKGYTLVSVVECNLIFVDNKYFSSVLDSKPNLKTLNLRGNDPMCIFVAFDGTVLSNKEEFSLPWHKIIVPLYSLQILPRYLRYFKSDYNLYRKIVFFIFKFLYYFLIFLLNPKKSLNLIKKKYKNKKKEKIFSNFK